MPARMREHRHAAGPVQFEVSSMSARADIANETTERRRMRKRARPKGRHVEPAARAAVQELLGTEPLQRDLLLEYLHRLKVGRASGRGGTWTVGGTSIDDE